MENEKYIWDFLIKKFMNPYGVAGIMGNLMAESSLDPKKATGKNAKGKDYISAVNNKETDFVHDGVAFGLAQWCYWSRKKGLLNYATSKGTSIDDLKTQLEYLCDEIQNYKTVIYTVMNSKNIREVSDIVMLKYERPAMTGEVARARRANYGQEFFDKFCEPDLPDDEPVNETKSEPMIVAKVNVNIRKEPSLKAIRLGAVKAGTKLKYLGVAPNKWYQVLYEGKPAYVCNDFVLYVE